MILKLQHQKVVGRYNTVIEAEKDTGIPSTNISRVLNGRGLSAGGFTWQREGQEVESQQKEPSGALEGDFKYKENGDIELITLYSYIPTMDDISRDYRIDTSRYKLAQTWIKARSKGWQLSVLISAKSHSDPSTITEERIEAVVQRIVSESYSYEPKFNPKGDRVLRIVYSDTHIGMEINADGTGMYGGSWGKKELFERLDIMLNAVQEKVLLFGGFQEIHVIDLGDLQDGLKGVTSRGGHSLPQNMSDEESYEVGVEFKTRMIEGLLQTDSCPIKCYSVVNCNHSPLMDYMINSTVQKVVQHVYKNAVEYTLFRGFINHYTVGEHIFILSHGKDSDTMKFGFKAIIDDKAKSKVEEYMKHNRMYGQGKFVTFEKGDTHIQMLDSGSSDDFHYNSYMAFSPSSKWVQHNFKKSRSGFNLMVIDPEKEHRDVSTYFFKWTT